MYRRLKREESSKGITVSRQQRADFWRPAESNYSKIIKPDIVLRYNNEIIIVDTKWKIIDDLVPSDDDLKQMFVYNLYWKCNRSVLLYPADNENSKKGDYHDFDLPGNVKRNCAVQTISVLKEGRLDRDFGEKVLTKLTAAQ